MSPGYDIYRPEINDDLQRFYDRYCKNIDNGWEHDTPPVRLSLLGFEADGSSARTVLERSEKEWPLQRTKDLELFLDASNKRLTTDPVAKESSVSYESHSLDDSVVRDSSHT